MGGGQAQLGFYIVYYQLLMMFVAYVVLPLWQNLALVHKTTGKLKKCWGSCVCGSFCLALSGGHGSYELQWKDDTTYRKKQNKSDQTRYHPGSAYNMWFMMRTGKELNPKLPPDMRNFGGGRAFGLYVMLSMKAIVGFLCLSASLSSEANEATLFFAIPLLMSNLKRFAVMTMFQFNVYVYLLVQLYGWMFSCLCIFKVPKVVPQVGGVDVGDYCSELVKLPRHHMWECPVCCFPIGRLLGCAKVSNFRVFSFYWEDPSLLEACMFVCHWKSGGCHEGYDELPTATTDATGTVIEMPATTAVDSEPTSSAADLGV
jgi:hypothetical protein